MGVVIGVLGNDRGEATVEPDVAAQALSRHMKEFRAWSYADLASKIDGTRHSHDCLHAAEGKTSEGEEYFVEINVFWDDEPGGDVRVIGDLTSVAKLCLE